MPQFSQSLSIITELSAISKRKGAALAMPPIPDPSFLDYFRCYSASGPSVDLPVALNDQFFVDSPETVMVLTPRSSATR